ncbi:branched-chain amino acid ABC transporter permease [Ectopseudomonas composti]|uniref:ABC transporter permease n=1 Tax=Ectopseudomonas mendocina S5.2 TaxID=1225174 RepID=A0ABN4IQ17_ECTME|nr:branched-chain amino acid ABC transporter permease [Pseudomonas mendocina]AEB60233.1 inner-membrane translocator [Pseudomonas mendocina NK-01]ALN17785.1 ABC transporter permease [Pseudomonas mendocina S5.2]KES01398.1 ABC transporter permease [Pseudomonas mendocina]VEE17383.1 inner-membrane translocator [Pseudomonas mendocina]
MNFQIALLLGQDGITNGAIYALLALSILLVFTVTRILLIPLGEFVTYGALTMAALQAGQPTALVWLLLALTLADCAMDLYDATRASRSFRFPKRIVLKLAYALAMVGLIRSLPLAELPMALQALLTLALVVPLGPQLYRLVFQPLASASALVLLIVSIAVHVAMVGVALLLFGPEGARTQPFSEAGLTLGPVTFNSQTLWVIAVSLALIISLFLFFERSLYGKALRATAVNRMGARLMGISPNLAGKATFALATFIGALSGILIAPITTLYFDSGFVISLKGFVGAIIGGLVSYPAAALGALAVGLIEAFSMFWASTYKEIIVFTLIIPFLLWRSLTSRHVEDDE